MTLQYDVKSLQFNKVASAARGMLAADFGFSQASERTTLNLLTIFGLVAVSAMVICYAFENRHTSFILAFALSCVLGSIYGFLQGAWPFGAVEAVWAVIAVRRWWLARGSGRFNRSGD